jgi:hypothetical protein
MITALTIPKTFGRRYRTQKKDLLIKVLVKDYAGDLHTV